METAFLTVRQDAAHYVTAGFDKAWPLNAMTREAAGAELIALGYDQVVYLEPEAFTAKVADIQRASRLSVYKLWKGAFERRGWSSDQDRVDQARRDLAEIGISKEQAEQWIADPFENGEYRLP